MRLWGAIAAVLVVLIGVALVLFLWLWPSDRVTSWRASPPATHPAPTLYCEFYNFTHNATVVAFDFAVGRDADAKLSFTLLFVVESDGTRTDSAGDAPRWTYAVEEEAPSITSPDAATKIVLYGLKPNASGVFWTEAGIRSNIYRNLEGKCRQAYLDRSASTKKT